MKLKRFYPFLIVGAFIAAIFNSCSPVINPAPPTTLVQVSKVRNQTTVYGGVLKTAADTNNYIYELSCTCAFPLAMENADTSSIIYLTKDLPDTIVAHHISALARPGLASGTHTGWIAIRTIQPITTELLRDTLRDTVMVP